MEIINKKFFIVVSYFSLIILISSQLPSLHTLTALSLMIFIVLANYKYSIAIYCFTLIWTLEIYTGINDIILFLTQALIIVKSGVLIYSKKYKFNLFEIIFLLTFLTYITLSVFYNQEFSSVKIVSSFLIFLFFIIILNNSKDNTLVSNIYIFYLISLNLAIFYGYLSGNFSEIRSIDSFGSNLRFNGVHAPNYMAFYLNIGFCMLLFFPFKKNFFKVFSLLNMSIALLLTQSTTGTAIFILLLLVKLVIWFISIKKGKKVLLLLAVIFALSSIFVFLFERILLSLGQLGSFQRLFNRLNTSSNFNLNSLTNNRFESWQFYLSEFFEASFINEFFGRAIFFPYSFFMKSEYIIEESLIGSHSTYIDLLWAVGIFGLLGFLIFNIFRFIKNKNSIYFSSVVMMKVVLVISMFSTSLVSNRLFFLILLL